MPFEFNEATLFYLSAAISVVLAAEAVYLLFFSAASYRSRVNRRLRLMQDQVDRQAILVQLRRERGLTGAGDFRLPLVYLNRLILQSGLSLGIVKFAIVIAIGAVAVFFISLVMRGSVFEAAIITGVSTVVLPFAGLRFMRNRRQKKFGEQFPDAIDIIVRSLRAGHPIPVAIAMVGRELPDPVGSEFGMVADEVTYGADIETAMRAMYHRIGQDDLPLFVTAVAIQGSTGGNLSEILSNLSSVIRQRFKMRRKIRALAAEGRFSALLLSALPIAMFFILRAITPDFYGQVWHEDITKIGLVAAGIWMMFGNFIMYRLVNFRI
ncbi:MAG TPA: type II secretion system F family protein [Xanthobacteraceae bacterium]|jgi:tight adherence protein B